MGHSVHYEVFPLNTPREHILKVANEDASLNGWDYEKALEIEFKDQGPIYKSKVEATNAIKLLDNEKDFLNVAVKFYASDSIVNKDTMKINKKLETANRQLEKAHRESLPSNRPVAFVTCGRCGSRINKNYLHNSPRCLICNNDLRSPKALENIRTIENKIHALEAELEEVRKNSVNENTPVMWLVKYEYYV